MGLDWILRACASSKSESQHLLRWVVLLTVALLLLLGGRADGQFFAECFVGSEDEFERSISSHTEHTHRLYHKFHSDYYFQGQMPKDFEGGSLKEVRSFISKLVPRRTGVLFYGLNSDATPNRLCRWLVGPSEKVYYQATSISAEEFSTQVRGLVRSYGTRGISLPGTVRSDRQAWSRVGKILLPPRIEEGLLRENVDTLIVVPIFAVGAVPFASLPLGGSQLVDRMSVMVAPGFFVFKDDPPPTRHKWSGAIVVGDPALRDQNLQQLDGAREEAQAVAELFDVTPLIGPEATSEAVSRAIAERPDVSLVYLATHGNADGDNPRDHSFLMMSDRKWTARDVGELRLTNRPLVVLSACQTGLGKNFDVGTIGMARAWQQVGASQVVMSLWNVDDARTSELMRRFVLDIRGGQPVDKALQTAMKATRDSGAESPELWAGFTIFGVPTR